MKKQAPPHDTPQTNTEEYYEFTVPGVGSVRVVTNSLDNVSEEEIQRRWDNFHKTASRLYWRSEMRRREQEGKCGP